MIRAILLTIFLSGYTLIIGQTYRYTQNIFPSATKTADIIYGTAEFLNFAYHNENSTISGDLVMDIYTPTGDTHNNRPAIIFAHSGGFLNGNRNHDDMLAFCEEFAKKGYVTATIDYRKGFYLISNVDIHSTRAAYRGLQDGRAAVRFLRANAATYGIDPNQIYFAGSSAGAFISLHSIFMDEPAEKPAEADEVMYSNLVPPFFYMGPNLGAFDVGNNLGFSGTPDAILSLWGAVADDDLITANNNQPALLVHGTTDGTVPFTTGSPFGYPAIPTVEGSDLINTKLQNLGLTDTESYFVTGEDHEFYGTTNGTWSNGMGGNAFWDIILDKATQFFWKRNKPIADFDFNTNGLSANFTDQSTDATNWLWNFDDGNTSSAQNPTHSFTNPGIYEVQLFIQNSNLSYDTLTKSVAVSGALPIVWESPLRANLENNWVKLDWSVSTQINNERFEIEHAHPNNHFQKIGEIAGDGNLNEPKNFKFVHQNPKNGLNFYRIKQIDLDGHFEFSNIVSVEILREEIEFFPNPASEQIIFKIPDNQLVEIEIYNSLGQLMKTFSNVSNHQILDISDLESGVYFLKINAQNTQILFIENGGH